MDSAGWDYDKRATWGVVEHCATTVMSIEHFSFTALTRASRLVSYYIYGGIEILTVYAERLFHNSVALKPSD